MSTFIAFFDSHCYNDIQRSFVFEHFLLMNGMVSHVVTSATNLKLLSHAATINQFHSANQLSLLKQPWINVLDWSH